MQHCITGNTGGLRREKGVKVIEEQVSVDNISHFFISGRDSFAMVL